MLPEIQQKKSKTGFNLMTKKLAIYAIHPIMYQTPIFTELESYIKNNNLDINTIVFFGDDLSLKETHFKETNVTFKPDTPFLLDGYKYKFLKNYARDSRSGFFSRINPSIIHELFTAKYDAILIHGYESVTAWITLIAAKLIRTKIIWRGEAVLRGIEENTSMKQRFKRFILERFFRSCDALMYSCHGNKKYLKFYGVDESKLFPIPCAVNNQFFETEKRKYGPHKNEIKKALCIPLDNLVILFSARFTIRKRPLDLLHALTVIDHKKITILFVGDGPERNNMETFAKSHNIDAIFTGFKNQSEISQYYSIADIDIVISDYDPSPKALNEAMNFELPIIVTNVVGTAYDLVEDGKNGFIVPPGDINLLADKIHFFNRNRDKIPVFGSYSLNIVKEWNYERDVEGLLNAFNYIIKSESKK